MGTIRLAVALVACKTANDQTVYCNMNVRQVQIRSCVEEPLQKSLIQQIGVVHSRYT